jgi:hypothetical protein
LVLITFVSIFWRGIVPENSRVDKAYKALRRQGMSEGKAARIAQAKTGLALATGKPAKGKKAPKKKPKPKRSK